jgi:phosphate/sulfate permease
MGAQPRLTRAHPAPGQCSLLNPAGPRCLLQGVAGICMSWVLSPVLAGLCALVMFWLVRTIVLRHANSFQRSFWVLPIFVWITFFVITIFIIKQVSHGSVMDES